MRGIAFERIAIAGAVAAALVIAGIVALPRATHPPAVLAQRGAPPDSWPSFRGGPEQQGTVVGELGAPLVELWVFEAQAAIRSSAVIDGERVYVGCDDGRLLALDRTDGTLVWAFASDAAIEAPPLLAAGMVFVGNTAGLFLALDAQSGEERWRCQADDKIVGSANFFADSDGQLRVLVGAYDNLLYCLDAPSGEILWTYQTDNYINGSPAIDDGLVVFGGCDGLLHVLHAETGEVVRSVELASHIGASPAIKDGVAYVGNYDNTFCAVDIKAGTQLWEYRHKAFPYLGAAAVGAERVVFGGGDRRVHCVRRNDGASVWRFKTGGRVESAPLLVGATVLAASLDGRLYALALADGAQLWTLDLGAPVVASPALAGGQLVIGTEAGRLYSLAAKAEEE